MTNKINTYIYWYMSQGIGKVYYSLVLPCSTNWLLKPRGRVLDFRLKGPKFNPWPGHGVFLRVCDKWHPL